MEKSELQQRIKTVTARVLKMDVSGIGDQANFIFDLGADSMQSLELVAAYEEEFDIEMEEDEALSVQTVEGAVEYIASVLQR